MQDEITRITSRYAAAANFNGLNLFKSENGAETTDGNAPNDASSDVIETNNTNASTVNSTGQTEAAINSISNARENFSAQQVRMTNAREALMTYEDNLQAAESKVRDIDMARESSTIVKYQTLINTSNAMLGQANQLPGSILRLIG
jgi:flagellin